MIEWVKALLYAAKKHKGQKDKGGKPYIFHPLYVSLHCKGHEERIVGLLHDVIEDTDASAEDLTKAGFSRKIIDAVLLLSKPDSEDYLEYIKRIKGNHIAAEVKRNDLAHNMNLKRLKTVTAKDHQRVQKYKQALLLLQ